MSRWGRLAALCCLTASCAIGGRKPFVCPAKGGRHWSEVASTHFVLTTDLDRDDAERTAAELEEMFLLAGRARILDDGCAGSISLIATTRFFGR